MPKTGSGQERYDRFSACFAPTWRQVGAKAGRCVSMHQGGISGRGQCQQPRLLQVCSDDEALILNHADGENVRRPLP